MMGSPYRKRRRLVYLPLILSERNLLNAQKSYKKISSLTYTMLSVKVRISQKMSFYFPIALLGSQGIVAIFKTYGGHGWP